jgi:hypothetical protein
MADTLKILIEFISFLRENCPNIKSEKVCQDQGTGQGRRLYPEMCYKYPQDGGS